MSGRLSVALHAVSVRRGEQWVLRQIDWQLEPGQRWALLGDNGAGKTQLLKVIRGDVWAVPGSDRIEYRCGTASLTLAEAKPLIAYVGGELQDKYARYDWNLAVADVIATGLHGTDLLLREVSMAGRRRVALTLRRCHLTAYAKRRFLSLSYGEKRLVLLARALVAAPDWLLLDEFYNGLDGTYRARLDAVLEAARRRGQAWVATAHRAADVPRGTTRLLELAAGRVRAQRSLLPADLERLRTRAGEAHAPQETLRRASRGAVLLSLQQVDVYVEYRAVLRELDWQLRRGEHWAILGANGAGKSTFLKLLYGDLSPALGGRISRAGCPPGTPIFDWKRQVGWVSPELQTQYLVEVSLLELVASGAHASIGLNDAPSAAELRAARRWLRYFDLAALADRGPREVSYGQLRRALIARAMVAEPRILLLDEPLTGLDPTQRAAMKKLLARLMRGRVTLVAAVHHLEDLPPGIRRVLHLHKHRAAEADAESAT
jgi:molybdate transport system ATP-binding protein